MPTITPSELIASGKIKSQQNGVVIFQPTGTNYELHLKSRPYDGSLDAPVKGVIRCTARKIWTVPSGGNFIAPVLGTPKTIQGRVRALDQQSMVVQAGTMILVEFPSNDSAFDLANGGISVGSLVNVTAQPGARIDLK